MAGTESIERAGFYPRAAALFVDLLVFAVATHLAVAADVWAEETLHTHDFGTVSGAGAVLIVTAFALVDLTRGGSPGKRLMRLRIAAADGSDAPRSVLARRAAAKFGAFYLLIPTVFLFAAVDDWGFANSLPSYTRAGLWVVAIVDAVIAGGAVLVTVAGCFRALRPDALAGQDQAAGTAVFRIPPLATRGFTPVLRVENAPARPVDQAFSESDVA